MLLDVFRCLSRPERWVRPFPVVAADVVVVLWQDARSIGGGLVGSGFCCGSDNMVGQVKEREM